MGGHPRHLGSHLLSHYVRELGFKVATVAAIMWLNGRMLPMLKILVNTILYCILHLRVPHILWSLRFKEGGDSPGVLADLLLRVKEEKVLVTINGRKSDGS